MRRFTPAHRAGRGEPLVCLHGFMDSWRSWALVLPALERRHEVLALTLPGHAGGPPLGAEIGHDVFVDAVERAMDEAGFASAHITGNSLGGFLALQLAARGRARTVVALAPAGGWAHGDESRRELFAFQRELHEQVRASAANADAIAATPEGRRRASALLTENFEHLPPEVVTDQILAVARCEAAPELIEYAQQADWPLDAEQIDCPVRIVWGTADKLLPWPRAAVRFREDWLPQADWVELDGVGHAPQLDVPLETAQLIGGFAAQWPSSD
ncbi:MAG TPA: alpha/beta fold hydrolase [Thermoleophilaceae bacterium]|nr:alpha/beta fold hydrolase [Thermoleophilaceae bacterium]